MLTGVLKTLNVQVSAGLVGIHRQENVSRHTMVANNKVMLPTLEIFGCLTEESVIFQLKEPMNI